MNTLLVVVFGLSLHRELPQDQGHYSGGIRILGACTLTIEEAQVKPFYAGTQFSNWVHRNCHGCNKYNFDGPSDCEIDMALAHAYFEYGFVPLSIAKRMGYAKESGFEDNYIWDCPERSA